MHPQVPPSPWHSSWHIIAAQVFLEGKEKGSGEETVYVSDFYHAA